MQKAEKGPRPDKVQEVEELREILAKSGTAILTDYRGLTVKGISALRKRLGETESCLRVVKNTLVKRAAEGLVFERLMSDLEGPTALVHTEGDPVAAAKALTGFIKEFKLPAIKGGVTDGHMLTGEQVTALASIAPRPVLLAQVVGSLQSPVSGLVGTLQQLYGGLVYTLQGIAEKKSD